MGSNDNLKSSLMAMVESATTLSAIEEVRVHALGKKGALTDAMKGLSALSPDERKSAGQELNKIKDALTAAIEAKKQTLSMAEMSARLMEEKVDVTLPTRPEQQGRIHPISQTIDEVIAIFGEMGFSVAEGPEIEDDWYNFTALNIPEDHPARQEHDTFYLPGVGEKGRKVLRTHTSTVQVHTMLNEKPPIRIIAPGRTYRCDYDATHSPMFHQVEGLVIDKAVNMTHLRGVLTDFCRAYFGVDDLPLQFRPSYFPFTEPSAEVDIGCTRAGGEFKIGHGDDWLEILGCGMVNEKVLENCNIDPNEYQGFAFGIGIERIAMLKYGIPDLRTFYESDLRWLRHYGFSALDVPSMTGGLSR
ncbi:MAG: phenylalanine--tRNA ligase subunit alpha [Rhodospirillaceae bacterium]|nr:phenylalanine--tRNA ligase subunit alpha [Rhodospirillaceae bacterium]